LNELLLDEPLLWELGRRARAEYEAKYTPQRNYEQLLNVYALAKEHTRSLAAAS
jgi:hypothetical protein